MAKNIILCCDGTGNEYGANKTNVVRACEIADCDDSQLVYYDPGVGTGGLRFQFIWRFIKNGFNRATGGGLQKNVEDGYRFLMQNYEEGDKIFLFGFSRGAFTVRSLAGMLAHCGLLRPYSDNLVEYASKIYNRKNDNLDAGFKADFARVCPVHFIGVWDTVESRAFFFQHRFHSYQLNPEIKYAYHAVAIDEKRRKFPPSLWDEKNVVDGQTMEQVWFAGVHSDVGGWYDERDLSDIALRWMLVNAQKCGMRLNEERFAEIKGNPLGVQHDSHKGFWVAMGKHERQVPAGAKVHKSVQERMNGSDYKPVLPLPENVEWVE